MNGREAEEATPVLDALPDLEQYVFCSSAGVYLKSDQMPHREEDAVDFKSRHKGKLFTEELLTQRGVNWTSVRPVYIYGPLNYNPVEEWFFHRLAAGRPVPVPSSGMQVTQLGHVKDLAVAFTKILGNPKAARQVRRGCSGAGGGGWGGRRDPCGARSGRSARRGGSSLSRHVLLWEALSGACFWGRTGGPGPYRRPWAAPHSREHHLASASPPAHCLRH